MPVSEGWRMKNKNIDRLIRAGMYEGEGGAVAQHRKLYKADTSQLIPYAVTLYSARKTMSVVKEFVSLIPELKKAIAAQEEARDGDGLDVISTHLLWWSKQGQYDAADALNRAWSTAKSGYRIMHDEERGGHTRSLLALTLAEASILLGRRKGVRSYLNFARSRVADIKDPDQRVRVYRKLAYIYFRHYWNPFQAWKYILRARSVKDVSPDAMNKTKILGV